MISILIPIYNFDVRRLVQDLHRQLLASGVAFEIICLDDASPQPSVPPLLPPSSPSTFRYEVLEKNMGRASIRNVLATKAMYPYLLFMDCDSKVVSPHYIQTYLDHLRPDTLLYGGRSYAPTPPNVPELYFHWHYGRQREVTEAATRAKQPYHSFMTNNFLIPKEIFEQIKFDMRLKQYGHEDTLFGLELKKRGIKILHLDNPLEHIGLEDVDTFLQKTRQGIQNLAFLANEYSNLDTKLLRTYKNLANLHLDGIARRILQILKPFLLQNLRSAKPNLRLFDLYKLLLLISAHEKMFDPPQQL